MDICGNVLRASKLYMGGMALEKNAEERRLLEFCDEKELSVAYTWFYKAEKRKITNTAGGWETEIDFVLVVKKYKKYVKNVQVIPWELQRWLVVIDLDKKVLKKIVKKEQIIRRNVWKLNQGRTRVKELVSTDAPDLRKLSSIMLQRHVMKYVERGNIGETEEACGGGVRRSRIKLREKRRHLTLASREIFYTWFYGGVVFDPNLVLLIACFLH